MSSLEIAELTGKNHKDVLRDIRKLLKAIGVEDAHLCAPLKMPSGQMANIYELDKQLTLTLVTGYNVKMRHAIIERWQYLECDLTLQATGLQADDFSSPLKMPSGQTANVYNLTS